MTNTCAAVPAASDGAQAMSCVVDPGLTVTFVADIEPLVTMKYTWVLPLTNPVPTIVT